MAETRRRIAAAAFELHSTLGPSLTTITAVAERAGVQRLTVYRHFPDEASLFRACMAHGMAADPPPEPDAWRAIPDPATRLPTVLAEVYARFRRHERLMGNVLRDAPLKPSLLPALE